MTDTASICPRCRCRAPITRDGLCARCLLGLGLGGAIAVESPAPDAPDPAGETLDATHLITISNELARGGLGAVFWGYDHTLERTLAVKVLQACHAGRADLAEQFLHEARLTGQLQHPGIVPVHQLGRLADGRPYFTMKLVRGKTLAALLDEKTSQTQLVRVLLAVSEAVAYAHQRGVLHRDIKPSNIMVGAHGEVQVMDWGLAVRIGDASSTTGVGAKSNIGTREYMAPELFEPGRLPDQRTDVYALGAVLARILTGKNGHEAIDALASQASTDLVSLAQRALAEASQRPADAGAFARELNKHFDDADARARQADIDRAKLLERAVGERRRRRLWSVIASLVVGMVVISAVAWLVAQRRADQQKLFFAQSLRQATEQFDVAAGDPGADPQPWLAAQQLIARIAPASAEQFARRDSLARDIEVGLNAARRDVELLRALELAWIDADVRDHRSALNRIAEAFRVAGMDVERDPRGAGLIVRDLPPRVRAEAVAALDIWAIAARLARLAPTDGSRPWEAPLAALDVADADPWRTSIRRADSREKFQQILSGTGEGELDRQPLPSLLLAARALSGQRTLARSIELLRRARERHPGDFWANLELSAALVRTEQDNAEALAFATAATSLRPDSAAAAVRRGMAMEALGQIAASEAEFRRAIAIEPGYARAYGRLANLLNFNTTRYAEAIDLYYKAESLDAAFVQPFRLLLGDALLRMRRAREAVPVLERATAAAPDDFILSFYLAWAYARDRRLEDARRQFALADTLKPEGDPPPEFARAAEDIEMLSQLLTVQRGEPIEGIDNARRLKLAEFCSWSNQPARGAAIYEQLMTQHPELLLDPDQTLRYEAAMLAVRAATRPEHDDPPPDAAERSALIDQALLWMQQDLPITRELLEDPVKRRPTLDWIEQVESEPIFSPVRSPGWAESLTRAQRDGWQNYWADLANLRKPN